MSIMIYMLVAASLALEISLTSAGYCSPSSTNCGAPCNIQSDCPNGDCWADRPDCGGGNPAVIGTYIGAYPGGLHAPPLSDMSKSINLVMLSFATDSEHDGNFKPFKGWIGDGLTWKNITTNKHQNPGRKFLVSLGGAVGYGGTFAIQSGMSTETWIQNSINSVASIIYKYGADGAEIQFEGGTEHPSFRNAMIGLINGLKTKNFITAIGPYYGGTWNDYKSLPMENIDYVNLQPLCYWND
ncbi:MAG: glycosyl hydrolase family 18 protein [Proteobacteria bacterium]|nr:glycosyl hydrolase family 18 protein [Pseudomonadota bacterium]